jgi:hypothetical protein
LAYRIYFPLLGTFFLWGGLTPWSDSEGFWNDLPIRLITLAIAAAFMTLPFRPRVALQGDWVVARGLIFRRVIALSDLAQVHAGYYGLTLTEVSGRAFTATGVGEKWNLSAWLGKASASDRVADLLVAEAKSRRGPDEP